MAAALRLPVGLLDRDEVRAVERQFEFDAVGADLREVEIAVINRLHMAHLSFDVHLQLQARIGSIESIVGSADRGSGRGLTAAALDLEINLGRPSSPGLGLVTGPWNRTLPGVLKLN